MESIKYLPLSKISEIVGVPASSLKVKVHLAHSKGIPLPPRRRIGRQFFYNVGEFADWLWQNADALQRTAFEGEKRK